MPKSKPKRIALYLPSLGGGGAERVSVTLANGLAERGYAVDLVLARKEGPYIVDVIPSVRVIDLDASRVLFSLPSLVKYLKDERPEVLLSALDHANVVALLAKRLARVSTRVIVSVHNTYTRASASGGLKARIVGCLMRRTYRGAEKIVAVSRGVADDLIRATSFPHDKVVTIYNPIVTDALRNRMNDPVPVASAILPPIVLAVGRLTAQKDYPTLLRAFAQVRKERAASLVILGEGEARNELEALVKSLDLGASVHLPGFAQNPYAWMRHADLFVMSSTWEGLPTVLVEAMACGTPVVSTDCPSGPAEILEGGKWGRLVSPGNPDALAGAIVEALDDDIGADTRQRAEEFSVRRAIENYCEVLG